MEGNSRLTVQQRKANIDLIIILIVTASALGIAMTCQSTFKDFVLDPKVHILIRTVIAGFIQFGIAGLGITITAILRKESFLSFGLRRKGAVKAILFTILAFAPNIIFSIITGMADRYLPFQSVWTTKEVLASQFPVNVIGMLLIMAAWGFFEGFNYVVISDKINRLYPVKNKWLNWGAIVSAFACLLIHGAIGITPVDIIQTVTVFIMIYGMLIVKEFTGNAWGCVFAFVFLWNAY